MVTALSVLGLMVNGRACHFYFARAQVTLEVSGVIVGVPETPLYIREERDVLCSAAVVGQLHLADLAVVIHGNECQDRSLQVVLLSGKTAVADTVTTFIAVKIGLGGFPARIPHGVSIFNIEILAVDVVRNIVVTVTCHTQQLGILIKGITTAGIGNQREKSVCAEVVDPG